MVIKLENDKPVGFPLMEDNFKQLFPDVTFPKVLFPTTVEPYGYGMYEYTQRPSNLGRYEKIIEIDPIKDLNGYWRQTWLVVEQTEEEKTETNKKKAESERFTRNRLLGFTDWSQLPDAPITSEKRNAFIVYRQALRDITTQPGFPWDIIWPVSPKE